MRLPEEFQTGHEHGLFARRGPGGELLAFGFASSTRLLRVDVVARTATDTTTSPWEDDVDFDEWLADWRDRALKASRPYASTLECAFCGKLNTEVAKLIAGPTSYICNECVELCHEILQAG